MSITILGMKDVSGLQRRERGSGGGMVGRMRVREEDEEGVGWFTVGRVCWFRERV